MMFATEALARFVETQVMERRGYINPEGTSLPTETKKTEWSPRTITVYWKRERERGYPWGPWLTAGAVVEGPRLKMDGTEHAGTAYTLRGVREDDINFGAWVRSTRPNPDIA